MCFIILHLCCPCAQETILTGSSDASKRTDDRALEAVQNIIGGFKESLGMEDVYLIGLMVADMIVPISEGSQVYIPALPWEVNVSKFLARDDGGTSFGSIVPPRGLQTLAIGIQAAATVFLDVVTDAEVETFTYQRIFMFGKAMLTVNYGTILAKNLIFRVRPDHSDAKSFFSGHTSNTFALATFLDLEINDWIESIPGTKCKIDWKKIMRISSFVGCFGWASYVGYSRIRDRKHYPLDVLFGAAFGTMVSYSSYMSMTDSDFKGLLSVVPAVGIDNEGRVTVFYMIRF